MTKIHKTNAIRLLEAAGVSHEVLAYDARDGRIDAPAVAEKLGVDPSGLFKTLVALSDREVFVFCVPGNAELDLRKAARAAQRKKIELAAVKDLLPLTGYVRGGCSPVGMKKSYPFFLDASAEGRAEIVVSGGAVGIQVRLDPRDLLRLTGGGTADLTGDDAGA